MYITFGTAIVSFGITEEIETTNANTSPISNAKGILIPNFGTTSFYLSLGWYILRLLSI